MEVSEYLVVYEDAGPNWSAYVPDLPGCITTGATLDKCKENIEEAIAVFVEATRESGGLIPAPSTRGEYVRIA